MKFLLINFVCFVLLAKPLAALDWPMYVAPKGCVIRWTGPNSYQEVARSEGRSQFPMILFSREDWGPRVYPFLPLCGDACFEGEGRDLLHSLFPLEEGKQVTFDYSGSSIRLEVTSKDMMPKLGNSAAYRVEYWQDDIYQFSSWWSEHYGWIVKYQNANFEKSVHAVSCEIPTS